MSLHSQAPTRIDLAGGTLDIWPLYLLVDPAVTVNVAIDLYATASLEASPGGWRLRDLDRGFDIQASSLAELGAQPGAELVSPLLRFFAPDEPLAITTRSMAPSQSGLGNSSALGIALAGALNAMTGFRYDGEKLVEIVKNSECRTLRAMTGAQDHYPGIYGGANCFWWGPAGTLRERILMDPVRFENRFLLAYTHQPHRSGANNWEVIKRFLDGEPVTRRALEEIGKVAESTRDALARQDLDRVASLLGEEWQARKRLAPEVSSPELERILNAALSAGADAGKVCGAGGGGCLLIAARSEVRPQVEAAIVEAGGSLIGFHVAPHGLRLQSKG